MAEMEDIGRRIARRRLDQKLTQGQLAANARVDRTWLSKIERGIIREVGIAKLERVAKQLNTTVEVILHGEGQASDERTALIQEIREYPLPVLRQLRALYRATLDRHGYETDLAREVNESGGEQKSSD